jgi:predicted MFS family arabinose efflux permease
VPVSEAQQTESTGTQCSSAGSDVLGRTAAFNGTLVLTAVFGVVAAFAPSFPLLCFSLLLLGTAVGVCISVIILIYALILLTGIDAHGWDTTT